MRRSLAAITTTTVVLCLTPAAAASDARRNWALVPTANPTTPTGFLNAVACSDPLHCEAVGSAEDASGTVVMLAERRDGSRWTLEPTAASGDAAQSVLTGVACTRATSCLAVGYSVDAAGAITPLAQQRDADGWHLQRPPDPPGAQGAGLFAVSCSAASACMAVGTANRSDGTPVALAERWDGTAWTIVPAPDPAGAIATQLAAVSCPSATFCVATGSDRRASGDQSPLAEVWDGDAWSVETTPSPPDAVDNNLLSVSCLRSGRCFAGGYSSTPDGTTSATVLVRDPARATWTIAAVRAPQSATYAELSAISCTSAAACTAVGTASNGAFAERWDGSSWTPQITNAPRRSGFSGISCATRQQCTAVGFGHPDGNYSTALAETWNGTVWQVLPVASPDGATTTNLLAVSCATAAACVAVGYDTAPNDRTSTLAERSSDGAFTVQPTPGPHTPNALLDAVSCPSPTSCTAVGYFYRADGDQPLAESWDGTGWTIEPIPPPPGAAQGADLRAVSCSSPQSCTAVGEYLDDGGASIAFAEHWDGSTWRAEDIAPSSGAHGNDLIGISCTGTSSCVAVGSVNRHSGSNAPLLELWDGTGWHARVPALPAGATTGRLTAISCSSPSACTAVGTYLNGRGRDRTLAVTHQGSSWQPVPTPNEPHTVATIFNAVSCRIAGSCSAVGYSYALSSSGHTLPPVAFAASAAGGHWTRQAVPTPTGTSSSVLSAVSCGTATCTATGYVVASSERQISFAVAR